MDREMSTVQTVLNMLPPLFMHVLFELNAIFGCSICSPRTSEQSTRLAASTYDWGRKRM